MSWVEVNDVAVGHTVLELQPTVVEVFRAAVAGSTRIHLRLLRIDVQGPDGQGIHRVSLSTLAGAGPTTVAVDEGGWMRLWPWVEQVRQTQYAFGPQPGYGLPPGYNPPPPGYPLPPTGVVDP